MAVTTSPTSSPRAAGDPGATPAVRTGYERAWDLVRELISGGEVLERMGLLSKETGLAPGSLKALQRLRRGGYLSMRDIARGLGCDPSYVTGLVDELAAHGLVERRNDPDDRRVRTVVLTPAGVTVADRMEQLVGVPPASFNVLTEREAEQLARILAKVTSAAVDPG